MGRREGSSHSLEVEVAEIFQSKAESPKQSRDQLSGLSWEGKQMFPWLFWVPSKLTEGRERTYQANSRKREIEVRLKDTHTHTHTHTRTHTLFF